MSRQDTPDTDAKAARSSYSLASAPLRLLSHSFHSTANAHTASSSTPAPSPALHLPVDHLRSVSADTIFTESSLSAPHDLLHHPITLDHSPIHSYTVPSQRQTRQYHQQPSQQHPFPQGHDLELALSATELQPRFSPLKDGTYLKSRPPRKKAIDQRQEKAKARASTVTEISRPCGASIPFQATDGKARLEKLLLPYDIRYSIFGLLSLQDIYNCQLTCKLLNWATSDQFIWKRIALGLIQGEFYFDIPRTLPDTLPNWKLFCKRHLLRQRNWRRGQVQDVISLDDNYKKLTTLQIMSPHVLTGCDDGRIHLWNVHSRNLLHRFQIHGEITWVEYLQEAQVVAGLGYDKRKMASEIRLFSTETGKQLGLYKEDYWDLAICAINGTYLVASDGEGSFTVWNWKTGVKVSKFTVLNEKSITESLYLIGDTILELHYDGLIRLFSINGKSFGRFTLDNILPNHQVSFCWLHNDYSMVVWESSNTMAHIRLPLLMQERDPSSGSRAEGGGSTTTQTQRKPNTIDRVITQDEWDNQGAEVYWRHQLEHTCNFAAMGGGRYQLLYVQILDNLMEQVPIRVHSLRNIGSNVVGTSAITADAAQSGGSGGDVTMSNQGEPPRGEYVTAHSLNPDLEKIIQGLRPSRIDCDPEFIVVGLLEGGVRLLQFAPVDEELFGQTPVSSPESLTG